MEKKECVKLPGAKFVLLNEDKKEIACAVTDRHGNIVFDDLPIGKYFIREIEAPCGFKKCDDLIEIQLTCCRAHRCIEVINERKRGSIKIVKLGCDK